MTTRGRRKIGEQQQAQVRLAGAALMNSYKDMLALPTVSACRADMAARSRRVREVPASSVVLETLAGRVMRPASCTFPAYARISRPGVMAQLRIAPHSLKWPGVFCEARERRRADFRQRRCEI
jgi:hypothetical protein